MVRYRTLEKILGLVIFLAFALPVEGWGAIWYVRSSSGEYGAENGTSYATAFDGFSGISWGSVNPGDTIYVCGTFTGETNSTGKSGTAGKPITLDGNCPNDPGVIDANGGSRALTVNNNYITVKNLTMHNAGSGYLVSSGSVDNPRNNVTFYGLTLYNTPAEGIVIVGSNMKVLNSVLHDIGDEAIWALGANDGSSGNVEIAYNKIYDIGWDGDGRNIGIFMGDGAGESAPIYVHHNNVQRAGSDSNYSELASCIDGGNSPGHGPQTLYIYDNYVSECHYGIAAGDQDVADTVYMYYNVVHNSRYGLVNRSRGTYYFYNNTIDSDASFSNSGIWHYTTSPGTRSLHDINNTVSGSYTYSILINSSGATIESDYNNYNAGPIRYNGSNMTLSSWQSAMKQDQHSRDQTPLFKSDSDYHLQGTSPLINAGTDVGLSLDFDGAAVPQGGAPDIGAYEYGSGSATKIPNAPQIMGIN